MQLKPDPERAPPILIRVAQTHVIEVQVKHRPVWFQQEVVAPSDDCAGSDIASMTAKDKYRFIDFQTPSWRYWFQALGLTSPAANLTLPEYIPTRLMQFFHILSTHFPSHRLITSDFHYLPNTIPGINSPVVQTRYQRRTVPVTTPMVYQGYFDILFPTDFAVMEDLYRAVTGRLTRCMTHEEFFRRWADTEETRMRSGENAMLGWYKNQSVLVTV